VEQITVQKLSYPVVHSSHRAPTRHDLARLEKLGDAGGHAVSFYFRPGEGKLAERDAMIVNLRARDIISNSYEQDKPNLCLLRDLDAVMKLSEDASRPDASLKVVFACHDRGIWEEFDLPCDKRIVRLEAGDSFDLAPLRRLLETEA
jgi:hypothetical protein